MHKEHKHQLGSGWITGGQTFRECVVCRKAFQWKGRQAQPVRSDYNYYKEMAEYHGNRATSIITTGRN